MTPCDAPECTRPAEYRVYIGPADWDDYQQLCFDHLERVKQYYVARGVCVGSGAL